VESLQHTPGVIGAASFFKVPLAAGRRSGEPILAGDEVVRVLDAVAAAKQRPRLRRGHMP
jgi:hypothetical protein